MTRMHVSLVTLGDPNQQTGGYLYHRRLAEMATRHDAEIQFVSVQQRPLPVATFLARSAFQRAMRANVVVVDSIAAAFVAPWLRDAPVPVVGMLHQRPGGIDHGRLRTRLLATLDRRAYQHMRFLMVASESLREEIASLHHDVRVVAPGRDVSTSQDKDVLDLRQGRKVSFLCVGNWVRRKGIVELLDAVASLPDDAATLHLVGAEDVERPYADEVRRRASSLGDRVVAHGVVPRERVAALYAAADVFVMPSTLEPYGTAYGEAMSYGLPVVGWDAGNLPYLAHH